MSPGDIFDSNQCGTDLLVWDVNSLPCSSYVASDVTSLLITATGCLEINDLRAVQRAVWDARSKWYDIGVELLVSPDTLDAIKEDKCGDCDACFREMLKEWLRRPEPRPTWTELAQALKSQVIGYGHLADKLPPQGTWAGIMHCHCLCLFLVCTHQTLSHPSFSDTIPIFV